jgi:hypothetical protein
LPAPAFGFALALPVEVGGQALFPAQALSGASGAPRSIYGRLDIRVPFGSSRYTGST